jgi:hypothetical protein
MQESGTIIKKSWTAKNTSNLDKEYYREDGDLALNKFFSILD